MDAPEAEFDITHQEGSAFFQALSGVYLHNIPFLEEIIPLHSLALEGVLAPHPGKLEISS